MSLVTEFRAAGDGAADDTAALQRTIDEGDGVLELPRGVYRITEPIVLDTTQQGCVGVRGAHGTARIVMAAPGPALRVVGDHRGTADPGRVEPHTWANERFPVLSGFEVLGDHPEADGIELFRTMQTVVRDVLIRKCRYGIHLLERNRNFILAQSHIYDCADTGLFLDQVNLHQTNIYGNHISYCRRAGIRQFNGDAHNIQITGNDIEYNSGHEASSGEIVLEVPDNGRISEYTIASNTLQATPGAHGANILIQGRPGEETHNIALIAITGNVVGSRDKSIAIYDAAMSVSITGNTIYGGIAANLHLRNCQGVVAGSNTILPMGTVAYKSRPKGGILLEDCADCHIVGNIINDHHLGDEDGGGAVTLRRCRNTAVTSCQILRPQYRGIYLEDAARCSVSGNTIADDREPPTMLAAVQVTGQSRANVIQNNTITPGTRAAIVCDESAGIVANNAILES